MTPIKRRLLYIFRGSLLRLRVTWPRAQSITLSVGYHVDRTDPKGKPKWDGTRCRPSTTHGPDRTPAASINRALEILEEKVRLAFYTFEAADAIPTPQQLRQAIDPQKAPAESFRDVFSRFIAQSEKNSQWAPNTTKSVNQVLTLILLYRPDITMADLTSQFLHDFAAWQQTHRISPKKNRALTTGYSNATIAKHNNIIRWFLRWADRHGYDVSEPKRAFTPSVKTIRRPVVFLTWDELMRLEALPLEPGSPRDRARDFFCFCAFTSLRYSDAAALLKSAVRPDSFDVVTQKTGAKITIDLNDHSRRILDKYRDTDTPLALPSITTATLNSLIKQIGREARIDTPVTISQYYGAKRTDLTLPKHDLLSSHAARRTFICNALALGIAPAVVMKWTGHADYAAMRPYIDIADGIRVSEMQKFNRPR